MVLAVDGCAVCDADFAFLTGSAHTRRVPVTLGHEVAATVVDSRAAGWRPGDGAVVAGGAPCEDCRRCREGRVNICERLVLVGVASDGGMAERLTVNSAALVRRPAGIDASAAANADAAAAAYHALATRGAMRSGDAVAVFGIGVPGGYALQIAKALGAAPVIAVDVDSRGREAARGLGADEVLAVEPGRSIGREIKLLTDGGADVAVDFGSDPATLDAAIKSVRPGGVAVAAGLVAEPLATVPSVLWALHEYELRGSFGSLPGDLAQVLSWLATGTLVPPHLETVALADAVPTVLQHARAPTPGPVRLIVTP